MRTTCISAILLIALAGCSETAEEPEATPAEAAEADAPGGADEGAGGAGAEAAAKDEGEAKVDGEAAADEAAPKEDIHSSPTAIITAYHQAWIDRDFETMTACVLPSKVAGFKKGFKKEFDKSKLTAFEIKKVKKKGENSARVTVKMSFGKSSGKDTTPVKKDGDKWYVAGG